MIKKSVNGQFIVGNWEQELLNSFSPVKATFVELIAHQEEPWANIILAEGQRYLVRITTGEGIALVNQLLRMLLVRIEIKFSGFEQYGNLMRQCMNMIREEREIAACHQ